MKKSSYPIFTTSCKIGRNTAVFYRSQQQIRINAPNRLLSHLFDLCDGEHTLGDILNELSDVWDSNSTNILFGELEKYELVIDGNLISSTLLKFQENPLVYHASISDSEADALVKNTWSNQRSIKRGKRHHISKTVLLDMLNGRKSNRIFSGEPIAFQVLINMVWSAYGELSNRSYRQRTVPSAGQLYPLKIHVVLFQQIGNLAPGIYEASVNSKLKVGFVLISNDYGSIPRTFVDPLSVEHSSGVIIISCSFDLLCKKYGNRGVLYGTLEAGHSAQNIHLCSEDAKIAIVEIGGFYDSQLSKALSMNTSTHPLTTLVFGSKSITKTVKSNTGVIVEWPIPFHGGFELPFSVAFARIKNKTGQDDWSSGKSTNPRLAYIKAVSEAKEWAACEQTPSHLTESSLLDLPNAIDPRTILSFSDPQYKLKNFPYRPFCEKDSYAWTKGTSELDGSTVYVLAELVYLSFSSDNLFGKTSSSGVAAHPKRLQAIENGVLELVERDSFMNAYLTRIPFPTINSETLPGFIQKRIAEIKRMGFEIWIKDHSIDLAPVVFIFVQNKYLSYTMCAASSSFDKEDAIDHALMEIELAILIRLKNGPLKPVKIRDICLPEDHGALYEQKDFFYRANFLAEGGKNISFSSMGKNCCWNWQELIDRLESYKYPLVTINLPLTDPSKDKKLHVVRSIIPGLIPLSFGYRQEPCNLPRIREVTKFLGRDFNGVSKLTKFPHPYT